MLNYEKNHLCLFAHQIVKAQNPNEFTCYVEPGSGAESTTSTSKSYNGLLHTPDGTLRLLIVYGGFEGFEGAIDPSTGQPIPPALGDWNNDISDDY